jgi:hypothetical protein
MRAALTALIFASSLGSQTLVADRGLGAGEPILRQVEMGSRGYLGDSFTVGQPGAIWMIDTIRLWAAPAKASSCTRNLGDALEKITLMGALENRPVPGVAECDCHALIPISTATLRAGSSAATSPDVEITPAGGLWQIEFRNVHWSMPGGNDVLFSLRATDRPGTVCSLANSWALAAAPGGVPAPLRRFNTNGVPDGFVEIGAQPVRVSVQVWAHRVD